MAEIDIESPGVDEAVLNAALGARVGLMRIGDPVVISAPVAYVDIALPSGYSSFELRIDGLDLSAADYPAIVISVDGGATFYNASDSYRYGDVAQFSSNAPTGGAGSDSMYDPTRLHTPGNDLILPIDVELTIFPGDADYLFRAFGTWRIIYVTGGQPSVAHLIGFGGLRGTAAIIPTPARVNVLRVLAYGSGSLPPDGANLIAGTISLFGVPTP